MSKKIIEVNSLTKEFKVRTKEQTFKFAHIFNKSKFKVVRALDNVSFDIELGEFVSFVGNNGAGKSTLIKILSGILQHSEGSVEVFGRNPCKNRIANNYLISVVFGQRTQLQWDLSALESFSLLKVIYKIDDETYHANLNKFYDIFDLESFIDRPVRTLSLGQKMRCEIASAFLHNPQLVFLDEPTIGLDIFSKDNITEFLLDVKKQGRTTLIFTSHDLNEVSKICDRALLIGDGKITHDKPIELLMQEENKLKELIILTENKQPNVPKENGTYKISVTEHMIKLESVPIEHMQDVLISIMSQNKVIDIKIKESSFSDIIKQILKK